jgi:hypothetical protein
VPDNESVRAQIQSAQDQARQQIEDVANQISAQLDEAITAGTDAGIVAFIGDIVNAVGNVVNHVVNAGQQVVNNLANVTAEITQVTNRAVNLVNNNTRDIVNVTRIVTNITPQVTRIIGFDPSLQGQADVTDDQRQASARQLLDARRAVLETHAETERAMREVTQQIQDSIEATRRDLS